MNMADTEKGILGTGKRTRMGTLVQSVLNTTSWGWALATERELAGGR